MLACESRAISGDAVKLSLRSADVVQLNRLAAVRAVRLPVCHSGCLSGRAAGNFSESVTFSDSLKLTTRVSGGAP